MSDYRKRQFEKAAARLRASQPGPPPPPPPPVEPEVIDPLNGVTFASDKAEQLARGYGLTWRNFGRSMITPTSKNGYTSRDVRRIHESEEDDATS